MNKARKAALLLITLSCATSASATLVIPVRTMIVKPTTITKKLMSIGTVESRGSTYIQTTIAGKVTSLKLKVGDTVTKGEVVATLNPEISKDTLDEAKAQFDSYKALYNGALKEYMVAEKLVNAKAMTLADLGKMRIKLQEARSGYLASKAQLAKARFALSHNAIRSSVDGIVQKKKVTVGSVIPAGEPIYLVTNTDHLYAILPYPENLRNTIKLNQKVQLHSVTAKKDIMTKVSHIQPMISPVNRSFSVYANFENVDNEWHPGASVTGNIFLNKKMTAFLVPEMSIANKRSGEYVYTVINGHAKALRVKTANFHSMSNVVITDGLKAGDKVVISGASFLTDGMPVKEAKP